MREYPPGKHPTAKEFIDAGFEVVDGCTIDMWMQEKLTYAAYYAGHELFFTPDHIDGLPGDARTEWRVAISPETVIDGSLTARPSVVAVAAPGSDNFIRCLPLQLPAGEF